MPHILRQLPYPKASLGIFEVFSALAHLDIDFAELEEQSHSVEEQLGELLSHVEQQYGQVPSPSSDRG